MPWRGPSEPGEFPTLGWLIGEWIEEYCTIPDGPQRGRPYLLTDEMWRHLVHAYRLRPSARVHPKYPKPYDGLVHRGRQLRRSQKWGKDPLMAACTAAHALGDTQFDGWDANGEPVARPVDTPWIQLAANALDQVDNTFRPLLRMLREGPLADLPGLDIGDTRVKLPNGDGWIEPVTASADARLGNPITWLGITEPHLMRQANGSLRLARAMKRGVEAMGGGWMEATNSWDPTEFSVAQRTAAAGSVKSGKKRIWLDHREPDLPPVADLTDRRAVRERIVIKYGDSARSKGGWVVEDDIVDSVQSTDTGEAEARRYFLDEITVGQTVAVTPARWEVLHRPGARLQPKDAIAIGFDGSRVRDCTAMIAVRLSDCLWTPLKIWNPKLLAGKKIPEGEVDQVLYDAAQAYVVWHVVADPYYWQAALDRWAGRLKKNPAGKPTVIDFPTVAETRMDEVVEMVDALIRTDELGHDGDQVLTDHAVATAVLTGKTKPAREDDESLSSDRYKRYGKRGLEPIDGFVAGSLGTYGRSLAIAAGALEDRSQVLTGSLMA